MAQPSGVHENGGTPKNVHAALPHPERSDRRKTSDRIKIIIQIHVTQTKKMTIDHRMSRNG